MDIQDIRCAEEVVQATKQIEELREYNAAKAVAQAIEEINRIAIDWADQGGGRNASRDVFWWPWDLKPHNWSNVNMI